MAPLEDLIKVCKAFPRALYDATSNLVLDLDDNLLSFIKEYFYQPKYFNAPFIKTSWDYKIRFNKEQELLWRKNVDKLISNGVVVKVITCLTEPLISEFSPDNYLNLMRDISPQYAGFERLTWNTTEDKTLIPDYDKVDDWLLDVYEGNDFLEQDFFSEITAACDGNFLGCRKRECMSSVLTINADGTIGACPNSSIDNWFYTIDGYKNPDLLKQLIKKEQVRNVVCYTCDLYKFCNGDCHQLSWQGNKCPVPKKLYRRIISDLENDRKSCVNNDD